MTRYPTNGRSSRRGRVSAGLLMYRWVDGQLEVFLARPGGPWFPHRQRDIWTIPKGEVESGEDLIAAAIREFQEEVGLPVSGPFLELGSIRQRGGKTVHAWAFEGTWDPERPLRTSMVEVEWPPGSGEWSVWPEIDEVGFFNLREARDHMKLTQQPFLDRLAESAPSARSSTEGIPAVSQPMA